MGNGKSKFGILKFLLGLTILTSIGSFLYSNRKILESSEMLSQKPKVFNNIENRFVDVKRIRITVPEGAFNINRRETGWQMYERSEYPVSSEKINEFAAQIAKLEKGEIAAQSPQQFDELGVGEPMEFGFGTIIELFDAQDQLINATHIGRNGNNLFVRKLGEQEIYYAIGSLGAIESISDWLDYKVFKFKSDDIVSNSVHITGFKEFEIKRNSANVFEIDGKSNDKINNAASAILNSKMIDVTKISRITNTPVLKEKITLKTDDEIEISVINQFSKHWLVIKNQSKNNDLIDTKTNDWAYAIDDASFTMLMNYKSKLFE
ncbi:MAG: DUF4340 domain-containing protein [Caulobacterales bacterium]|nr:DUF4340 domain-containing protein [Caulobacterales bacterium]